MDFGWFYDENAGAQPDRRRSRSAARSAAASGSTRRPGCSQLRRPSSPAPRPVYHTCHRYGAFNTEPRMASYLGIAAGQIPAKHYWGPVRTFHDNCD